MKRPPILDDPMETIIAAALDAAGIAYKHDRVDAKASQGLDFYLPEMDLYIEVKQFHSDRIAEQMSRAPNVIAIQGIGAAVAFARMLGAVKRF
ncbi:hypothetical protein [Inquilinus sp. CA228]|uniref:hypothetical protein n=1 Tax=Inquilinus sp. CA228 TaxID=3455609 RepID=UPI003F8D3918